MSETQRRSAERFNQRNRRATAKNRPRQFIQTPFGHALTVQEFLKPTTDFLAGRLADQPDKPPKFLREPLMQLADPDFLALAGVAALLDSIFRCWDRDDPSLEAKLSLKVGDDIYQRLRKEGLASRWGAKQRVQAGEWLLTQVMALEIFGHDEDGLPCISDIDKVAELEARMIAAGAVFVPLLKPPPPWTGWAKSHDGFPATFVRDWQPETQKTIEDAFLEPTFEHAKGVNALASVPLRIDPVMLALVEQFAVELMVRKRAPCVAAQVAAAKDEHKARRIEGKERARHRSDQFTVASDATDAKWCGDRAIWLDYNCDWRGRIYGLQHLNFARADHVRSLFRFANGAKLDGDTYWLEIHCANCEGSTDKEPRGKRIDWVQKNRRDIADIAADPVGNFDKWKKVDSPFAYVAACRELAAAWDDPENFVTHLPVGFDGSANGLQHLALLSGDWKASTLTNLTTSVDVPIDAYRQLIGKVFELIQADPCDHANWWRERFRKLDERQLRKLLKTPLMAIFYGLTPYGAVEQIADVYWNDLHQNENPAKGGFSYLADLIFRVCKLELPLPTGVMAYIRDVADHCTDENRFMQWTGPSGFPVSNRYQEPNIITVTCLRGSVRVAQHKIADGWTDKIDRAETKAGASPNFIHAHDAAHLVKVVNAAASKGIVDLLTVHDCFYCLAPQATRFHEIILAELADMYRDNDPLTELRDRNVSDNSLLPVPLKGQTFIWADGSSSERTSFPLESVKKAKHAFG